MPQSDKDDPQTQFEETRLGETHPAPLPAAVTAPVPQMLSAAGWLREGLRAGFLLQARLPLQGPAPAQFLVILGATLLAMIALARVEVVGPAIFNERNWLLTLWQGAVMALVLWCARGAKPETSSPDPRPVPQIGAPLPGDVAAWFILWLVSWLPPMALSFLLAGAQARGLMPATLEASETWQWALFGLWLLWALAVVARLAIRFAPGRLRAMAVVAVASLIYVFSAFELPPVWEPDTSVVAGEPAPVLQLTQETFLAQEALWLSSVDALVPQRPGTADVYGIVFAPYAPEDVFLRESNMVAQVLAERFDAAGRVVELVNHVSTTHELAWATPLNLQRTIEAVARKMDPAEDVLVIYLTSHGASDFKLAASHSPLQVEPVTPLLLRQALDQSGIRHRIVAVSACYSGGWVAPLADDGTLVMTAADATHTSYGCGMHSPLTFFGRAVFDEQLRSTHSFEQAFERAVPVIRQREIEGKKPDGFSNPQISVGVAIRPLLADLSKRLDAQTP